MMAAEKKTKDLKDLGTWEEDLRNIKESNMAMPLRKRSPGAVAPDTTGVSEKVESEWEERIKEARRADKPIIAPRAKEEGKFETIDQVFEKLKKEERERPAVKAKISGKRLDRIGGSVLGEFQEVKPRELTGQEIPGIYNIFSIGTIPPFNLLSKMLYSMSQESLGRDLENAKIPLYADEYASFSVAVSFLLSLLMTFFILLLTDFSVPLALLAFFAMLFLFAFLVVNLPSIQVKGGTSDIEKQLPFALRHMSSLLSAGISIFDSIVSVSKTDYGNLSSEFDKIVWDVKSGENLSDALEEAAHRVGSHSFMRVTIHIRRALQMGGDIAGIITQIADDLTFEMRMKVSDFVEKLNAFAIVYIIGGIVGPVVVGVFSIVGNAGTSQVVSAGIDRFSMFFLMLILFPLVMVLITYVVHVMEPKV